MTDSANQILLDLARARLIVHQAGLVRACLDVLNDGQIWWRANEDSNSIGNLVLHLTGSTRFFIGHGVGNSGYVRDREREFSEPGPLAREELIAHFEVAMAEADRVLKAVDPVMLDETNDRTGKIVSTGELIFNQVLHFTSHAGQVVYATKLIQAGLLDEVWKNTPMQ